MLLTEEERVKFVAFLRQEATTNDALARQLADMNLPGLSKRKRALAAAQTIVAVEMESWHQETIGGGQ